MSGVDESSVRRTPAVRGQRCGGRSWGWFRPLSPDFNAASSGYRGVQAPGATVASRKVAQQAWATILGMMMKLRPCDAIYDFNERKMRWAGCRLLSIECSAVEYAKLVANATALVTRWRCAASIDALVACGLALLGAGCGCLVRTQCAGRILGLRLTGWWCVEGLLRLHWPASCREQQGAKRDQPLHAVHHGAASVCGFAERTLPQILVEPLSRKWRRGIGAVENGNVHRRCLRCSRRVGVMSSTVQMAGAAYPFA